MGGESVIGITLIWNDFRQFGSTGINLQQLVSNTQVSNCTGYRLLGLRMDSFLVLAGVMEFLMGM